MFDPLQERVPVVELLAVYARFEIVAVGDGK
jgi:hypothetical protein